MSPQTIAIINRITKELCGNFIQDDILLCCRCFNDLAACLNCFKSLKVVDLLLSTAVTFLNLDQLMQHQLLEEL